MAAQDSRDGSIMELREVNRMMYLRPDNGSLVDKRTHKEYNFSNLSYKTGSLAQSIIQSGADGIWGPSSYLKVPVTLSSPIPAPAVERTFTIDNGTLGLNMIESVRLTHRSGEIIEFIDNFNLLGHVMLNWDNDLNEVAKLESMLNAGSEIAGGVKTWTLADDEESETFNVIIPLWLLLGCFANKDQYIPPNFLAGAKLELKIANADVIFKTFAVGGVSGAMTISPSIVLDSAKVYDSVAAQILDQQADVERSGLQFTYSTWFNNNTTALSDQVNVDVQQSASITEKVLAIFRNSDVVTDPAGEDSFLCLPIGKNYQWRLGSTYYPQARVNLAGGQGEAYQQTLIAWDSSPNQYHGYKSDGNCAVGLRDFSKLANFVAPHYATTLEKSAVGLTLTGEPTNNARSLNFSGSISNPGSTDIQIYLKYTRIANVMGENLVVDR